MGIDHDMVLCSLYNGIVIMVDGGLAVMIVSVRDDRAHISALDGIVAVFVHEGVGLLHPMLVVAGG